jgi:hypothetical protein
MRKGFIHIVAMTVVVAGASWTTTAAGSSTTLVFSGNGLNVAHLGTGETLAMSTFIHLLGKPTSKLTATPALKNCGVEATAAWSSLEVFFNHRRLVGVATGPGHVPAAKTVDGLRIGDTLARARVIYGAKLRTSTQQAGTWFVTTSTGIIDGLLNPGTAATPRPTARILTIDVGNVGCPAMSP